MLWAGGSSKAKDDTNKKGKLLYQTCTACHGEKGEGNTAIQAPSIHGLPEWYLISTLNKFKNGIRGAHHKDLRGLNMRPIARALQGKGEVEAVAKYVHSLPPVAPKHTLNGDAEKGKPLYVTCLACHGAKGEGNLALKAPPIANLPDWYVVNQLEKFKEGIRGTHPKDIEGAQMAPMAKTLPNKQAMIDLAAFIATFQSSSKTESKTE